VATAAAVQTRLLSAGLRVVRARDGAEVRALVAQGARALVAASALPDMAGAELVSALRAANGAPLAIFLLAPEHDAAAISAGFDAGADDVLTRPVNAELVAAKLRRAMAR
jgi:serine/threonine-protein kinase